MRSSSSGAGAVAAAVAVAVVAAFARMGSNCARERRPGKNLSGDIASRLR